MTRRTLDLPDAPGVWIWRNPGDSEVRCVQVHPGINDTLYFIDGDDCTCDLDHLYEDFGVNGKWQGPIEWEE